MSDDVTHFEMVASWVHPKHVLFKLEVRCRAPKGATCDSSGHVDETDETVHGILGGGFKIYFFFNATSREMIQF